MIRASHPVTAGRESAPKAPLPSATNIGLVPIADTFSGAIACSQPEAALRHYERLAKRLWLSPRARVAAEELLGAVGVGKIAWGSLVGPYGFGKTATAVALWAHARAQGFLAIPPLSCTSFDELARGIAHLAAVQAPEQAALIRRLFDELWSESVGKLAARDSARYQIDARTMRRLLHDKVSAGELLVDGRCHRLVEFLSRLAELASGWCRGLVIILDEMQQLLGPLDARAIVTFREFVWGIRTERAPCGVVLCMDTLLAGRLERWAADLMHRIREQGPVLSLTDTYTADFPRWLFEQVCSDGHPHFCQALDPEVLVALGQFMERPDLASGPRTVADVFSSAAEHFQRTGSSYSAEEMAEEVRQGRLRYFGENAALQRVLVDILSDEWVSTDSDRERMVRLLSVFPAGCPEDSLRRRFPDEAAYRKLRWEIFGPLLVDLANGPALEGLQRVRRHSAPWEQIVARCWDALPALDVLVAHSADLVRRTLVSRLFPPGNPSAPLWEQAVSPEVAALTGWQKLRGSFTDEYPKREVALWVDTIEPTEWPLDQDVCIALICRDVSEVEPPEASATVSEGRVVLRLPVLRELGEHLPPELARFGKYLQPEPLRPVTLLLAVQELEALVTGIEPGPSDADEDPERLAQAHAFVEMTLDCVLREMLHGSVVASRRPISLRGPELLRALFVAACRARYPDYATLATTARWREHIGVYRQALGSPHLTPTQCQGAAEVAGKKANLAQMLFGQSSTAAFDSFQKSLGPLLAASGDAENFRLRFALHPAERLVLGLLRESRHAAEWPFSAITEVMRHNGYLPEEAEEIVTLLQVRQMLQRDGDDRLSLAPDPTALRTQLAGEASTLTRALSRVGAILPPSGPPSEEAPPMRWQEWCGTLRERLRAHVSMLHGEVTQFDETAVRHLGTLRATPVLADYPEGDFQVHLQGCARALAETHEGLMGDLRRLRERIAGMGEPHSPEDTKWAAAWLTQRDGV